MDENQDKNETQDETIKTDVEVGENPDRLEEYFQIKDTLRTLRKDLRDMKDEHPDAEELKQVSKKAKELRENVKNEEDIRIVTEKISSLKERQDLLKEIIKAEMVENEQTEIKVNGRKFQLVEVLKETRDE